MSTFAQLKDIPGLPASIHAEVAILGAMMLNEAAILDATERLTVHDFSLDSHRKVYAAILGLLESGMGVDLTTVREALGRRKELEAIGGPSYLAELAIGIPRNLHIESYVRIVKDKALLRQLMAVFKYGETVSSDQSEEAITVLRDIGARLEEVSDEAQISVLSRVGEWIGVEDDSATVFEKLKTTGGIDLGWTQLDEATGGLQPGELWIVAARPSMGKTAFACNAAWNTSVRGGKTTAFYMLEQKREAAIRRMMASAGGVDHRSLREGTLSRHEQSVVLDLRRQLAAAPLYIADGRGFTASKIAAMSSRLRRTERLDIAIVDQLSHVDRSDVRTKGMPKHEQVAEQSRRFKDFAVDNNVPVVVFNQLSRVVDKRTDPTPKLSDLAESGAIEQDADGVIFLHRPRYYDKDAASEGQMILAKNREGETGTYEVEYDGPTMRWTDDTAPRAKQDSFGGYR